MKSENEIKKLAILLWNWCVYAIKVFQTMALLTPYLIIWWVISSFGPQAHAACLKTSKVIYSFKRLLLINYTGIILRCKIFGSIINAFSASGLFICQDANKTIPTKAKQYQNTNNEARLSPSHQKGSWPKLIQSAKENENWFGVFGATITFC